MHGMHACMEMEGVCFVNGTGETHWTRELDTVTAVLLVVLTKPLSTAVGLGEIGCSIIGAYFIPILVLKLQLKIIMKKSATTRGFLRLFFFLVFVL